MPVTKWTSVGGVVFPSLEDLEHVYVLSPREEFWPRSYPQGPVDAGESPKQAVIREVWVATGIRAKFLSGANCYIGKDDGTQCVTHYFLMYRVGGEPKKHGKGSDIKLISFDEATNLFTQFGNRRDVKITHLARQALKGFPA